jgi:hypothetical protein
MIHCLIARNWGTGMLANRLALLAAVPVFLALVAITILAYRFATSEQT